jgi:hypothetical protein
MHLDFPGLVQVSGSGVAAQYVYLFQSISGDYLRVRLERMRDFPTEDCVCPIGMEPFDKCVLSHAPEASFLDESRADFCIARLPCGHRFGIMSLVGHVVFNNLKCPMCRVGAKGNLHVCSLPRHLQGGLALRVADSESITVSGGEDTRFFLFTPNIVSIGEYTRSLLRRWGFRFLCTQARVVPIN